MLTNEIVIAHTQKWINDVVVGCNFCPFAAREVKRQTIHYEVLNNATSKTTLEALAKAFETLDTDESIETMFIILPDAFTDFYKYLDLLEVAEKLLEKEDYEGVYQIAGFHPQYLFAGSKPDDAANFTNRSPYPMLHLLREASVTKAVDSYPDTENIPQRNIAFAQAKGLAFMQALKDSAMKE